MPGNSVKRKLTAILCADVKGYSRMMGEDEVGTFHTLSDYLEIMNLIIAAHRGDVFSSPGDAILAQFRSVVDAVQCAVEIQEKIEIKNVNLPEDRKMQFRIGVNIGDVIEKGSQIYGNGVNIAARLETLADPGGICISKTALEQIEDKLPLGYKYLGKKAVKNIAKPIIAYKVLFENWDDITSADKAEHTDRRERHQKIIFKKKKIESETREKDIPPIIKKKGAFPKHFWIYVGVVGFFFTINIFTWHGSVWFHWIALTWGLLVFIHWIVWKK